MRSVLLLLLYLVPFYLADPSLEEQFKEWEGTGMSGYSGTQKEEAMQRFREMGIGHCMTSTRLSPIDIDLGNVTIVSLPELKFDGYHGREMVTESFKNNFTATIHGFKNWTTQPVLSGGPLNANFHLVEAYWDVDYMRFMGVASYLYGHTVNSAKHDLEIHFVHTKDGMALEEAQKIPGAVVNLAIFVDLVRQTSPSYYGSGMYPPHHSADQSRNESAPFKWASVDYFLPEERDTYFVYNGTLAHPPCNGNITWIVLANSVHLSTAEFSAFLQSSRSTQAISTMRPKSRKNPKVLFNRPPIPTAEEGPVPAVTVVPVPVESSNVSTIVWAVIAAVVCVALIIGVKVYYFPGNKSDSASKGYNITFDNQNFDSAAQITPFSIENPLDL